MKTFSKTIIFLISLGLHTLVFANPSDMKGENYLNCPTQVTCSEENMPASCKAIGSNLEYWNSNVWQQGNIVKGVYKFNHVEATFQSPDISNPICYYTSTDTGRESKIRLGAKSGSNLEIHYGKDTKWEISGNIGNCISNAASDCPLTNKPELLLDSTINIDSKDVYPQKISASLYGSILIKEEVNISRHFFITFSHEDISQPCGQKNMYCPLEISVSVNENNNVNTYKVGTINVNLENNKIKIFDINLMPNSPYQMRQEYPFNTIKLVKASNVYCPYQLFCASGHCGMLEYPDDRFYIKYSHAKDAALIFVRAYGNYCMYKGFREGEDAALYSRINIAPDRSVPNNKWKPWGDSYICEGNHQDCPFKAVN